MILTGNSARPWFPLGVNLVGGLAATAIAMFLIAPRTALGGLIVLSVLPYMSVAAAGRQRLSPVPPPLLVAIAILALYAMVSAFWSVAPWLAVYTVAICTLVLAASWGAVAGIELLMACRTRKLAIAVSIGFAIGLAFVLVEELSNDAIKRFVFNLIPFVNRNPKHMILKDTEIIGLAVYLANRNVAAVCLLLWPVLGMLAMLLSRGNFSRWLIPAVLLVIAAVTTAVLSSEHETSALALLLGSIAFVVSRWSSKAGLALITTGWLLAITMVIPLAHFAYDVLQLQTVSTLPHSARARIVIWKYTASQTVQSPIIGVGAGATEKLDLARTDVEWRPNEPVALRTGRHAHNVYLQVWYELGAIGALLLLLAGASAIGAMRHLEPMSQPFAVATFATAAGMAATSWSLWQEWFMAAFALAAVGCWLAGRLVKSPAQTVR